MYSEKTSSNEYVVTQANFTLDNKNMVILGDENFYQMFGEKTIYTFDKIVHQEDRERFLEFVNNSSEKEVLVRCINAVDIYRWLLIVKQQQEYVLVENKQDYKLFDIDVIRDKYELYRNRVVKYRGYINMMDEKLFEYDYKTGIITIFRYINNRSEIFEKINIIEWKNMSRLNGFVKESQFDMFNRLCDNIITGTDEFQVTFRSSIMSKGEREDILTFRGETITNGVDRVNTIGTIKEHSRRMQSITQIPYDIGEANKDSATGLLNKKAVTQEVMELIKESSQIEPQQPMYLIIVDIDNFKKVNDAYGHLFGDEVIAKVAGIIKQSVAKKGVLGRIGGDEFLVFLNDVSGIEEVKAIVKSFRKNIALNIRAENSDYVFTTSIGIAEYPANGSDFESLFMIADACLYIAKEKGKDRYIIYDKEKHGDLVSMKLRQRQYASTLERWNGIDKVALISDMVFKIGQGGMDYIKEAVLLLLKEVDFDGVSIFEGDNLECTRYHGQYADKPEASSYIYDNEYLLSFDKMGIRRLNNVAAIAIDYPDVFARFSKMGIKSCVQMLFTMENGKKVLVQCDKLGESKRKWSDEDVAMLYSNMKAVVYVIEKEKQ